MRSMDSEIIRLEKISKRFSGKIALEGVDLSLYPGEVLGLIGDNGAGKSTLLKILSGAIPADGGTFYWDGKKVWLKSPLQARQLGIEMVYQDLSLCRNLSLWENIFLGRVKTYETPWVRIPLLKKRAMKQEARKTLGQIGIHLSEMNRPVHSLSGGEQQAVAICRCLLFLPRVILLDEPTASMALWEKQKILALLRDLKKQGRALIMVTHNLQDLFQVADRVLVLKEGRGIWCGPLSGKTPEDLARMMFAGL